MWASSVKKILNNFRGDVMKVNFKACVHLTYILNSNTYLCSRKNKASKYESRNCRTSQCW